MPVLTDQEPHNLAMNIVGKALEDEGYEFLGINSDLKKNPQFVALRDRKLHFVVVRAVPYPIDPKDYDQVQLNKIRIHAEKFNARTFYGGVGLAKAGNYEEPVISDEDYVVNFDGLQEILK